MEYRPLGRTGLEVSSIGLGCVTFGREIDKETSFAVLDHALERGINLLDTAEAYAAGELKHGPLALVDNDMPVVAVAPNNQLLEKLKSNLEEVRARGGQLYVFADPAVELGANNGARIIRMPAHVHPIQEPLLYTVPLQLLAYHAALLKGTDVDQPRNLAKSVTVE